MRYSQQVVCLSRSLRAAASWCGADWAVPRHIPQYHYECSAIRCHWVPSSLGHRTPPNEHHSQRHEQQGYETGADQPAQWVPTDMAKIGPRLRDATHPKVRIGTIGVGLW